MLWSSNKTIRHKLEMCQLGMVALTFPSLSQIYIFLIDGHMDRKSRANLNAPL